MLIKILTSRLLNKFRNAVLDKNIKEEYRMKYHLDYCLEGLRDELDTLIQNIYKKES